MYQALAALQTDGSMPVIPEPKPYEDPTPPGGKDELTGEWGSAGEDDHGGWDSVNEVTHDAGKTTTHRTEGKANTGAEPAVLEGAYPDEKELKAIRKSLNICTVVMGVCTLGIGLLWCILSEENSQQNRQAGAGQQRLKDSGYLGRYDTGTFAPCK